MTSSAAPAPPAAQAASPPAAPSARPLWRRLLTFDNRFLAPLLITGILIAGDYQYRILELQYSPILAQWTGGLLAYFSPTFIAIIATMALELVLGRLVTGKWPFLASAYISGISVGILIKSPDLWPFVLCGFISIASKYALRVGGRHIWNPTNFGVTAMLFFAPRAVATLSVQSGNNLWPVIVIWTAGALILGRLGRLHIPLAFAAAFVPLAYLRSILPGGDPFPTEVAQITGPMYQLFMCFMITDPKTTTRAKWSQCLVAVLVAAMILVLREFRRDDHAPYHALFIVGPIANLIEIAFDARKKRAKAAHLANGTAA